jgi:HNH endonuclease
VRCRRCQECQRVFRPSSRHLRCPSCRSRGVCECGRSKQVKSATCGGCRSVWTEANGNWKGGRTRHKAGYVMVRAPGHPRATSGQYVFEHILVAEDLLGRHLHDGETVHHRNGVRDDNRPENLELWTSPQPSGIRVSDAIEWARAILERYEGVGAPPTTLTILRESPWRWRDSNRPRRKCVRRGQVSFTPLTRENMVSVRCRQ